MFKRTRYRLPVFLCFFCTVEMASGRAAWCRDPDGMAGRFGATKPDGLPASRAWCLIARKPLFLRRGAPRRMGESEHGDERRGASPPASPCFFVAGHHAPDFLQPDNSGNPPRVPGIPISPKKRKLSARCCSRNTLSTFPFPLSISRDCPLCTLRGQSLS